MTLHRSLPSLRVARVALVAAATSCLLLAGCASDSSDERDPGLQPAPETPTASPTDGPTGSPTGSASPAPGAGPTPRQGDVAFTELASFAETRLRMEPGRATFLTSRSAVTRWLPDDARRALVNEVDAAAARVGDGIRPYGLVLAVGCDAPAGYSVAEVDGEVAVIVEKSPTTTQCLAPTTWLAVVGLGVDG